MNFHPIGTNPETGEMFMKFHKPFTPLEKIQLLQRSILVNSFAYYELNENLLSDFQYDDNAKQLTALKKQYPDEFKRSRYHLYFHDYCSGEDDTHYTSGFDLLKRVEDTDKDLYRRIWMDAAWASDLKMRFGTGGIR
jgi:hypothetical protein